MPEMVRFKAHYRFEFPLFQRPTLFQGRGRGTSEVRLVNELSRPLIRHRERRPICRWSCHPRWIGMTCIRAAWPVGRDVLGDMHRIGRMLFLTCCTVTDLVIGRTTASEAIVRSVATRQPIGVARRRTRTRR